MSMVADLLRRAQKAFSGSGMYDGVPAKVQYRCGFEVFNYEPYVCHETWCCAFEATCHDKDGRMRWGWDWDSPDAAAAQVIELCFPESDESSE